MMNIDFKEIVNESRIKILVVLYSKNKQMFIDEIAKETGIHPRMVSHHIMALEKIGFVECKYEMVDRGMKKMAVKLCRVTPKFEKTLSDLCEWLASLLHSKFVTS